MEKQNNLPQRPGNMTRRSFLRFYGMAGIGLATAAAIPVTAEAVKFDRKTYKVSRTRLDMGTFVAMTIIHPSRDQAESAMGAAFEEIHRLTGMLNRFKDDTAVGELNREGTLKDVPPELSSVISSSLHFYRISNGDFDITVAPLVDLFMECFAGTHPAPPSEKEIKRLISFVGAKNIVLRGNEVRFKKQGMKITLDGIAKGYIVDRAADILTKHGIRNFLINAGGDIRVAGENQRRRPWSIAIQDPKKKQHYPDIVRMTSGAIATSGDYEVYFDRQKLFYHIINPKTGLSPHTDSSVSVVAPTTMEADAMATGVFTMDPAQGVRFIDSLTGYECLIVADGDGVLRSKGWKHWAI